MRAAPSVLVLASSQPQPPPCSVSAPPPVQALLHGLPQPSSSSHDFASQLGAQAQAPSLQGAPSQEMVSERARPQASTDHTSPSWQAGAAAGRQRSSPAITAQVKPDAQAP